MREGRYRKGESKGYDVTFSRGNRRAYIKARLERDGGDDLLTRVRAGEMTAKAIRSLMGGRSGWPGIYARSGAAGLWARVPQLGSWPKLLSTSVASGMPSRAALR